MTIRHLMLDSETLGLGVDAAVWQLAIREFNIDKYTGPEFVVDEDAFTLNALVDPVTVSDNIKDGKQSMMWSTVQWLEGQPSAPLFKYWAKYTHRLFHYDTMMAYEESLQGFVPDENLALCQIGFIHKALMDFIATQPTEVHFWAKGKEFDKPILENMFASVKLEIPWKYYNFHCVRDAFGLGYLLSEENPPRRKAKTHDAWNDCAEQLDLLGEAFAYIKG